MTASPVSSSAGTDRRPPITTMGVSAGDGMVHCALVTVDDHERLVVDSRVIEVDRTDRVHRADLVNSGIDLMLGSASDADLSVAAIGVASRTTDRRGGLASRGVGPRRQIHLVGDIEAVAHALIESGEIATHPEVLVVDCGDSGVTLARLDTATGELSGTARSTSLTGFDIDTALADAVDDIGASASRSARAALVSACRTAKEELAEQDSATIDIHGRALTLSASTLATVVTPMARTLTGVIADFSAAHRMSMQAPVVLVGGVGTIAPVRRVIESGLANPVITPTQPDLLGAVGAALLARPNRSSALRLEFIGGRRHRDWWSAVPLAVVGCVIAVAMLAVYAFGAALDDASEPVRDVQSTATTTPAVTTAVGRAVTDDPVTTTRADGSGRAAITTDEPATTTRSAPVTDDELPTTTTLPTFGYPNRGYDERQARPWATTQLPEAPDTAGPTSTITATTPPTQPTAPGSSSGSGAPQTSPPLLSPVQTPDRPPLTPYPFVDPFATPAPGAAPTPSVAAAP